MTWAIDGHGDDDVENAGEPSPPDYWGVTATTTKDRGQKTTSAAVAVAGRQAGGQIRRYGIRRQGILRATGNRGRARRVIWAGRTGRAPLSGNDRYYDRWLRTRWRAPNVERLSVTVNTERCSAIKRLATTGWERGFGECDVGLAMPLICPPSRDVWRNANVLVVIGRSPSLNAVYDVSHHISRVLLQSCRNIRYIIVTFITTSFLNLKIIIYFSFQSRSVNSSWRVMSLPFTYTPYSIWAYVNCDFKYSIFVKIESDIPPGSLPFLFRFIRLFVGLAVKFSPLRTVSRGQRPRFEIFSIIESNIKFFNESST